MKNIKNHYICGRGVVGQSNTGKKACSCYRSAAEEKRAFKKGGKTDSLFLVIDDDANERLVRRIVEKRVCKEYWKKQKKTIIEDNKHRAATKQFVSIATRKMIDQQYLDSSCLAA